VNWQGTSLWAAGGVIVGLGGAAAAGIAIASDATNGLYLSWDEQYILASGDIRAQRVDFAGSAQWGSDGLVVCNVPGRQSQAAMDGWGALGAVVTWTDERLLNPGIYAQRINVAGTPQWAANGAAVPLTSSNGSPAVRTDGSQAYVSATTNPIQLEKLDSNGAQVWGIDVASIDGTAPKLVSDGSGGVNVVWNAVTGGDDDIYDRRILPSGTPAWVFAFRLNTDNVNNMYSVATTDGAGGIYAAWSDVRTGTDQIYLSRVTVDGMVPALGVERRTPRALLLGPARPQPAHADVQVDLDLPDARQVHASIVDAAGRTVSTLLDGGTIAAGRHALRWDGRDRRGTPVPPGLYFLLVRAPSERASRRIVITR